METEHLSSFVRVKNPLADSVESILTEQRLDAQIDATTIEHHTSLSEHFHSLTDPREAGMVLHPLLDIITIAVCAVICGADDWVGVETFAKSKQAWLSTFLELPNGIPTHDTFNRVFRALSATEWQQCFAAWMTSVVERTEGEIVAIDGKCLRRSHDKRLGKAAIHMVSAWAHSNRVVLGQVKTEEKSNEITAIPELLTLLDIRGCIVTIDAAGCQKRIAQEIIAGGGDYVLALKGNQGTLHQDVNDYFAYALATDFKGIPHHYHDTVDGDHGRIETRRYWTVENIDWLDNREQWAGLQTIGMVESLREVNEKVTTERRFYIASLSSDATRFGHAVRAHWSIENDLHWSLDVTFREDLSRLRKDNGAENFSVLRHMALSLLKQENSQKTGIANKRLRAALDEAYLLKVLTLQPF